MQQNKKSQPIAKLLLYILSSFTLMYSSSVFATLNQSHTDTHYTRVKKIAKKCGAQYEKNIARAQYSGNEEKENIKNNSKLIDCFAKKTMKSLSSYSKKSLSSYAKVNLNISLKDIDRGGEYASFLDFDAIVPIWKKENKAIFLQPGFVSSMNAEIRQQHGASIGLVYRFVVSNGVIGVNVFYDYNKVKDTASGDLVYIKRNFNVRRASMGLDYQSDKSILSFNYYLPSSKWSEVQINDDLYRDGGAKEYEFSFKRKFTQRISAFFKYIYTKYEPFKVRYPSVEYSDGKNRVKSTIGLEYKITCDLSVSGYVEKNSKYKDLKRGLSLNFAFGGGSNDNQACFSAGSVSDKNQTDSVAAKLFTKVEREKKITLEKILKFTYELQPLPQDVNNLFVANISEPVNCESNDPSNPCLQNSDEVWIWEQGGPVDELNSSVSALLLAFGDRASEKYIVHAHQYLTLNPTLDDNLNTLTYRQAQAYNDQNVEILDRIIKHFKSLGKKVVVFGHSNGAFTVTRYLWQKGPAAADKYVIMSGRLDIEEKVVNNIRDRKGRIKFAGECPGANKQGVLSNGNLVCTCTPDELTSLGIGSCDPINVGTNPVVIPFGDIGDVEAGGRSEEIVNRERNFLLAAVGKERFTKRLSDTDLSKVFYVYGENDSQVGRLSNKEIAFLKSKGAQVGAATGGLCSEGGGYKFDGTTLRGSSPVGFPDASGSCGPCRDEHGAEIPNCTSSLENVGGHGASIEDRGEVKKRVLKFIDDK